MVCHCHVYICFILFFYHFLIYFCHLQASSLMIVSLLGNKAALAPKLLNRLINSVAEVAREGANELNLQWFRLSLLALINLVQVLCCDLIVYLFFLLNVIDPIFFLLCYAYFFKLAILLFLHCFVWIFLVPKCWNTSNKGLGGFKGTKVVYLKLLSLLMFGYCHFYSIYVYVWFIQSFFL
jgi:hypothetical protein